MAVVRQIAAFRRRRAEQSIDLEASPSSNCRHSKQVPLTAPPGFNAQPRPAPANLPPNSPTGASSIFASAVVRLSGSGGP